MRDGRLIQIVGVGSAGCRVVSRALVRDFPLVRQILVETDAQHLNWLTQKRTFHGSLTAETALHTVVIGERTLPRPFCSASPEWCRLAAEEQGPELCRLLQGCRGVVLVAGLGGATGTGALPVVARIAREAGLRTTAVVSTPFRFEGRGRAGQAAVGLAAIEAETHATRAIHAADVLGRLAPSTPFREAWRALDEAMARVVMEAVSDTHGLPPGRQR